MGIDYNHPDHGEMEWYEFSDLLGRIEKEGYRCVECHVMAPPDEADEVFGNHNCEQYQNVTKGITETL